MKENSGKTKYAVLGLLAHCPQTGYTIKKSIEYEYSHFWQESYGQIYPTLKFLVEQGLAVSAESVQPSGGRVQKTYQITQSGRAELKKWLEEAPEIEKLRYEILLKVSFGSDTEPKVILGHLTEFMRRNEKLMEDMDGFLNMFEKLAKKGEDHMYHKLTALCGKYVYTAMRDWALEAQNIILNREAELCNGKKKDVSQPVLDGGPKKAIQCGISK